MIITCLVMWRSRNTREEERERDHAVPAIMMPFGKSLRIRFAGSAIPLLLPNDSVTFLWIEPFKDNIGDDTDCPRLSQRELSASSTPLQMK